MNIPSRLKHVVESSGLTITDAAAKCGIPYSSLQNYLRGEREPKVDALVAVSSHLGISIDWLLTGQGEMSKGAVPSGPALSPRETALLELFNALDESGQREIQTAAEEKKRLKDVEQQLQELSLRLERQNSAG